MKGKETIKNVEKKIKKKGRQSRSPGDEAACFGRAVESGGTFQTFREEKVTKLRPKNIANY